MGMLNDLGLEVPEAINLTGAMAGSWIYVALIILVGVIACVGIGIMMFFMTYNRRVVIFENLSGQGFQPVVRTRARIVKLGVGGEELLKTQKGGLWLSAYGRKMGKNTYWYARGQDGYLYNILLGDLDAKKGMLDIEPIDRDVRLFHVALDRLSHQTYGKTSFMEKYGVHMMLFVFLIVLILGIWFIVAQIGEALAPLTEATKLSLEIQKTNAEVTSKLEAITNALGNFDVGGNKGLVPAE